MVPLLVPLELVVGTRERVRPVAGGQGQRGTLTAQTEMMAMNTRERTAKLSDSLSWRKFFCLASKTERYVPPNNSINCFVYLPMVSLNCVYV